MTTTMSQKAVRESLGNPELFEGGVYVTKTALLNFSFSQLQSVKRNWPSVSTSANKTPCSRS